MDKYDMNGGLNDIPKSVDNPKANLNRVAQNIKDRFGLNIDGGVQYFEDDSQQVFPDTVKNK
jgi:hypothetical protein